jgi:GNAT superfamily N-acetyltransferase
VDAAPVWSVTCFFVARDWRGRGLTVRLLKAAAALARHHGARWIEGYPVDTRGGRTADAFVFTGTLGAFRSAGFREVARRSPTRPVMRRALRASARQPPAKQRSQPGRSIVDSDSFRRLAASCHVSRKTRLGGA